MRITKMMVVMIMMIMMIMMMLMLVVVVMMMIELILMKIYLSAVMNLRGAVSWLVPLPLPAFTT